jgi:hypothetical protein
VYLPHYREFAAKYNLKWSQYGFLNVCKQFQSADGNRGWVEVGVGNEFDYITGLKNYIFWACGLKEATGNKMFATLLKKGFLHQEQIGETKEGEPIYDTSKFKVTSKFEVTKNHKKATEGITDTPPEPTPEPHVKFKAANTDRLLFNEVPFFKDLQSFTNEVKSLFKILPPNFDFKTYYEGFNTFYSQKAFKYDLPKWQSQIKTYIKKGIDTDKVKTVVAKNDDKEAVFAQLKKWKNKIEYPTPDDKNYRGSVLEFVDYAKRAAKNNWLNQDQLDYLGRMESKLQNGQDLRNYQLFRLEKAQNTEGSITPDKTEKTVTETPEPQNTEGVQTPPELDKSSANETTTTNTKNEAVTELLNIVSQKLTKVFKKPKNKDST